MKNDAEFDAHFLAGLRNLKSGKIAESLEEFFTAAQIDPSSYGLHYYIGEALDKQKQAGLDGEPLIRKEEDSAPNITAVHPAARTQTMESPVPEMTTGIREATRYQSRIPIIVVAYDINKYFFAELALTRVTSTKGASIEMARELGVGAQLMLFTIDSSHAVPCRVCNVQMDEKRPRYHVGLEFLSGPVHWLVPQLD